MVTAVPSPARLLDTSRSIYHWLLLLPVSITLLSSPSLGMMNELKGLSSICSAPPFIAVAEK